MTPEMRSRLVPPQELTDKFPWRFILIAFGISWTCWFFVALTGRNIFTYNSFILLAALALVLWRYGGKYLVRDYRAKGGG